VKKIIQSYAANFSDLHSRVSEVPFIIGRSTRTTVLKQKGLTAKGNNHQHVTFRTIMFMVSTPIHFYQLM